MRFRGKTAVVTGGSSGMGFAAAQAFLAEGANVAICGRTKDKLDQATERLKGGTSGDVMAIAADVSRIADLDRLYQQVSDRFGKIHVVFANAGVGIPTGPDPVDESTFDKITSVNFKGVFFTVQQALPHMADGGAVVLNASLTQHQGLSNLTVYAATKAAVSQMARSFSTVLLPRGIRVNAVSPGVIDTDMTESMDADAINALKSEIPMQRLGQPEDVAKAVMFLASDDAGYITGEDLLVDGGRIRLGLWQGA